MSLTLHLTKVKQGQICPNGKVCGCFSINSIAHQDELLLQIVGVKDLNQTLDYYYGASSHSPITFTTTVKVTTAK